MFISGSASFRAVTLHASYGPAVYNVNIVNGTCLGLMWKMLMPFCASCGAILCTHGSPRRSLGTVRKFLLYSMDSLQRTLHQTCNSFLIGHVKNFVFMTCSMNSRHFAITGQACFLPETCPKWKIMMQKSKGAAPDYF